MALIPNQLSSQLQITAEPLPTGISSYIRTLAVMAGLVRAAVGNYRVKQFANRLLSGIQGHDFQGEIVALFFSLSVRFATHAIRLMWSWYKTRFGQSRQARATVTTNAHCLHRSWPVPDSCRASFAAVIRLKSWITFGWKFYATGTANGWRLILPPKQHRRVGVSTFRIALNGRFFNYAAS